MELKISLIENALDSIYHGLDHLKIAIDNNSSSDYKQSILLIFQGVELILKELLVQENPIYMFDKNALFEKCIDPQNPKLDELYNCKSLDIKQICTTIKKLYPDLLDKESFKIIECSAKIRNKIQHFSLQIDKQELSKMIAKMHGKVISPALRHIGKRFLDGSFNNPFKVRVEEILQFDRIACQEVEILKMEDVDFERGSCFACRNYTFFFIYSEGPSYPESCYCTSCGYSKGNLSHEEKYECPECGAFSLLYCQELEAGICLWYNCGNHKEGGLLTTMEWCSDCNSYNIESICKCNSNEENENS
ncbi:hypothetical protein [Pelosinus sp. IPA-1]|uniref:hypothetical protein n=1 Tax=Pelosinus sp. IPA-1 TaxID=3029569 RepID=UPI0024362872|nr:hypothetical protein [Pelosinus sp. IPA-1]GMA99152.1 hypothetical protein PIPA1_19520 [Pelosinus sp. IPA-1]